MDSESKIIPCMISELRFSGINFFTNILDKEEKKKINRNRTPK